MYDKSDTCYQGSCRSSQEFPLSALGSSQFSLSNPASWRGETLTDIEAWLAGKQIQVDGVLCLFTLDTSQQAAWLERALIAHCALRYKQRLLNNQEFLTKPQNLR